MQTKFRFELVSSDRLNYHPLKRLYSIFSFMTVELVPKASPMALAPSWSILLSPRSSNRSATFVLKASPMALAPSSPTLLLNSLSDRSATFVLKASPMALAPS
eukprot:Selendium_serpulae@DN5620_c0_g1_i4.p1